MSDDVRALLDEAQASHYPERDGRCASDVEPMPCTTTKLVAALRAVLDLADDFDGTVGFRGAATALRTAVAGALDPAAHEGGQPS